MKSWLILSAAMLMAAGAGALLAFGPATEDRILIAGDRPVTEDEVKERLQSQGWLNVEIHRSGDFLQVRGVKDAQERDVTVDSRTGRFREDDGDDD